MIHQGNTKMIKLDIVYNQNYLNTNLVKAGYLIKIKQISKENKQKK
ncbi:hypothetical protein [Candidatus Vesicomyidisocius sp. SY067_SCS001]